MTAQASTAVLSGFVLPRLPYMPRQQHNAMCHCSDHWITGSLGHWITGSLNHWITGSLDHWVTGSLGHQITGSLDHWITGSLGHWVTRSLDHTNMEVHVCLYRLTDRQVPLPHPVGLPTCLTYLSFSSSSCSDCMHPRMYAYLYVPVYSTPCCISKPQTHLPFSSSSCFECAAMRRRSSSEAAS
jgi:hypothetical protein